MQGCFSSCNLHGNWIHVCVSCEGFPLTIQIALGKEHDRNHFVEVMENIKIKTDRRPRTRPSEILADSAYDEITIRKYLRRRAIKSNIPINIRNRKYPKRGRPTRLGYELYRKIASRYERLNVVFKGLIEMACFLMCWKRFQEKF
ncbi:transposase [Methanohalophilus mahii]|uniref:Transposase IS4-like domain-containing protein n=1 Tax=Methanohalophilus mahii (strain ATCC 35705 / DSM 5219 / SLP) TaxID=547558 RepID=D5E8W9_METMS|nr:transposase [Methanohalophilus mahii]ADE35628.1 hypothetical protein Mmah_0092 [Methanohalophilus mahii DSM 5219]